MISKVLLGVSIAGLIGTLSLGWMLKNQYKENGLLQARNSELNVQIEDLALANSVLNMQIDSLLAEKELLIAQIREGESEKRRIRSQLEVTNNELREALSNSPEFRTYQVPEPVSIVVGRQLDRLWPTPSNDSENRNAGGEAASP